MSVPTIVDTLYEISAQLQGIHASIKRQTELLVMMKNQSSANESAKAQEAVPAPKAITWQEAVKVLADECAKVSGCDCVLDKCPMHGWCSYARKGTAPAYWVVPIYEMEAASDE